MSDKVNVVIALGYFDCVHIGHRRVIESTIALCKKLNCKPVVFTFDGNLRALTKGDLSKRVYSLEERKAILTGMGIKDFYIAPTTKQFLAMDKRAFLDNLNEKFNIKAYVSGEDYRFGAMGSGNVDYLKEYAFNRGQTVVTVPMQSLNEKTVSTTYVKELLTQGKIEIANQMLGDSYFVSGVVFRDRNLGSKIGFPTINVKIDEQKHHLKNGVYQGRIKLDKWYKAVINYGARPTFNLSEKLLEAHIIGYDGDLYDKTVTVYFEKFIREIKTFNNADELKLQLKKDVEMVIKSK